MSKLTDGDIDFIYDDLRTKGLTLEGLIDEMVDHICCIIEPQMASGISFSMAYHIITDNLDKNTFSNIQHQTIISTNLKFQNMKKTMIGLGVLGTVLILIGSVSKSLQIPFAGINITGGVLITVFGFLPLFFYSLYKEQVEPKNIYLSIVGYLTASALLLGVLFKVQHWPWTHTLILTGQILLVLGFMPVYLVGVFKKAEKTNVHLGYIILIVGVGLASIYMASTLRASKTLIVEYDIQNKSNVEVVSYFTKSNDSLQLALQNKLPANAQQTTVNEMRTKSKKLNKLISQIEKSMLKQTGSANATIVDFPDKDNDRICGRVMSGYRLPLSKLLENYRGYMISIAKDKAQKLKLTDLLSESIITLNFAAGYFKDMPLIGAMATLTNIQKNVALAENEILTTR